jgi:hypothetical protein
MGWNQIYKVWSETNAQGKISQIQYKLDKLCKKQYNRDYYFQYTASEGNRLW